MIARVDGADASERGSAQWEENMRYRNGRVAWIATVGLLLGVVLGLEEGSYSSEAGLTAVARDRLCVTEGEIGDLGGNRLAVSVPKMRAYVEEGTAQAVEVRFKYLGSTGSEARLGSGAMRRQFGLKLRAQDACNLVYAMWRIEPEEKLVVSVKSNPGEHTSAQCTNHGYRNVKPRRSEAVPHLRPGDSHTLRAEMNGDEMRVFADGGLVWEGSVGGLDFDGPVGIRSDNAKLEFELRTGPLVKTHGAAIGCRQGESE